MQRKYLIFSTLLVIGVFLDQITKWWVRTNETIQGSREGIVIIPHFFSFVHAENPGAAFGMLGDIDQTWRIVIFVVFALIATGVVWDIFRRLAPDEWFMSATLGLILSGAFGNVIDRVVKPMFGMAATVTDFIRVYTDDPKIIDLLSHNDILNLPAEYPTFNVADISLVVGVGLFIVHYLFIERRNEEDDEEDELTDEVELDEDDADDEVTDEDVTDAGEDGADAPTAPATTKAVDDDATL